MEFGIFSEEGMTVGGFYSKAEAEAFMASHPEEAEGCHAAEKCPEAEHETEREHCEICACTESTESGS